MKDGGTMRQKMSIFKEGNNVGRGCKNFKLNFDEFLMNKNWEKDEYKALEEFCASNHYTYEVLAISFFTKQVAVKIIGI